LKTLRVVEALLILLVAAASITPMTTASSNTGGIGIHDDFPHARVVVTEVVDGDTIRVSPPVLVGGAYRTVVRLADIQAQEDEAAKDALKNLLAQHAGVVYLDIDKARGVDPYGRVIAVVYVRVNETTLLNVNKWMVDNGHASVADYPDNDFDPSKWSLYVGYDSVKERLPQIKRVVVASPRGIINSTSWGVKIAVTPDGEHIGVAFSETGTHSLIVAVLDREGNIVRTVNLTKYVEDSNLPVAKPSVFRGMLTIAANNTGFLVAWTQYSATIGGGSRDRIVLYTFIPIDPSQPIPYNGSGNQWFWLFNGSFQYHPHATWYCTSAYCGWIIGYQFVSNTTSARVWLYRVDQDLVTKSTGIPIPMGERASPAGTGVAVGVDVLSGFMFDNYSGYFAWVQRNYTSDYNIEAIRGSVISAGTVSWARINVDDSAGDQGPPSTNYTSGGNYFTYFDVYPMHSSLLASGGYLLTVYNDTYNGLAYAVVYLQTGSREARVRFVDSDRTLYPWTAGGNNKWLLGYSGGGWTNITLVGKEGSNPGIVPLADRGSAYVRAAYDSGAGLFPVAYAVRDLSTGNYNVFLALVNEGDGSIGGFVIPVNTTSSVSKVPVNTVVLPGNSPGTVVLFTVEGGELAAYYVSSAYPDALQPVPIPEPFAVAIAVSTATLILVYYVTRGSRKPSN
jgi:endonuclease YncB( thermonuclease family)